MTRRKWLLSTAALVAVTLLAQGCLCFRCDKAVNVRNSSSDIHYNGRYERIGHDVVFGHSGARMCLRFRGRSVAARIHDDSGNNYAVIFVDGAMKNKIRLNADDDYYVLADNLSEGVVHTVEIVRATECDIGLTRFESFVLPQGGHALPWKSAHNRKIEFIGDSVTCAYGVEAKDENEHFTPETENYCLGYAGLAARQLDADYLTVARSGIGVIRNYGGPYEGEVDTMPDIYPCTFYKNTDYKWDFSRFVPDVVCINIGSNDYSTDGIEKLDSDRFVEVFTTFAKGVLRHYPDAKLVIVDGPMGSEDDPVADVLSPALYRIIDNLNAIAPGRVSLARLSPEGPYGFGADWHPSRKQSEVNAAELRAYLSTLMNWK